MMHMPYRILIADDQEASRKLLRQMIEKMVMDSFEIIDEARDGEELIEKALLHQPDLVLCDIEMPKIKGIEAIREIQKSMPSLDYIFTTAHESFAVEAFELYAVDYVLKPIQMSRLMLALERGKAILEKKQPQQSQRANAFSRIPIRFNRSMYYIQVDDILFIEKNDRKSVIHTLDEQYSSSETLEYFLDYLDNRFVQSHRSFIINLTHVARIQTSGKSYLVYFNGYEEAAQISKQNIQRVQQLLDTPI
ncbi:response regulator [Pontibacillus yanchengensis]|uniref:Response regulator n=3 Tax=Pontibacillus yanchengensis TaxID=462910 RepID=A0ACC7VBP4_9BACI|nr:response regulator [Pontibacillus yanchengensis]MYL52343.1 response regulator [Pontibacillus yanchengensis]